MVMYCNGAVAYSNGVYVKGLICKGLICNGLFVKGLYCNGVMWLYFNGCNVAVL